MGRYMDIARQAKRHEVQPRVPAGDSPARVEAPSRRLAPEAREATHEHKAALLELLRPYSPPVLPGPDPLDYRRDPLTGAWLHDPGWWRGPAQVREIHEARAPCSRCGGTRFWVTLCHSEICATCYPPRPGDRVLGWLVGEEVH
ncbi:MAG: hypothetical protein GX492_05225 [Firmicutes bacterium]|nr:hypothetical protein [Bacillota bacterium]HHY33920.1 hypothetical protein [Bacillota bacterium]